MERGRLLRIEGLALVLFAGLLTAPSGALQAQSAFRMNDAEFVESLSSRDATVDRNRFAKLLFSVASTLDSGQSSARLLQERVSVRGPSQESLRNVAAANYQRYAAAVDGFRISVSALLDESSSDLLFFRALMDGHRACSTFLQYSRFVETYGASTGDLLSVLASSEVCQRFRLAAFQPSVEAIVSAALRREIDQREELLLLREELRDLEAVLGELERIEGSRE